MYEEYSKVNRRNAKKKKKVQGDSGAMINFLTAS